MSRTTKVDFTQPPINEVVCGALFERVEALRTAHFGLIWGAFNDEFPKTEDRQPLLRGTPDPSQLTERRVWLLSDDERNILQLQRDRFHFNWRRLESGDAYPHFEAVYTAFRRHLETLRGLLLPQVDLALEAFELTYINVMPLESDTYRAVGQLLADLPWGGKDFLGEPGAFQWAVELPAKGAADSMLRVAAQSATRRSDDSPVLRLELTVRGAATEDMDAWFDAAHENIIYGFLDLTTKEAQATWGRRA